MGSHPDAKKLRDLLVYVRQFQDLARAHGINDVFQDNGGKILQTLLFLGLKRGPGREGADALDDEGREYELKSLNRRLVKGFTTHHHLNHEILVKYRAVHAWYFSAYEDIELIRIYRLVPT